MATIAKTRQPVRMPRFGHRVDKTDPILRGCVGWWPLNDGAGTKAKDISGRGNDGTQSGGVTWASTEKGTAASFDGVDGRVTGSMNLTAQDFTISFWAEWDDYGTSTVGFIFGGRLENLEVHFGGIGVNGVRFIPYDYDGATPSNFALLDCASMVRPGWNLYTFTAEKTGYSNGYLNGRLFATSTTTGASAASLPLSQDFNIGARDVSKFYYLNGQIQNVRFWNRALSPTEVSRLYQEPWAGLEPLSPFSFFSVPTAGAPLAVFYNHYKNQGII